MFNLNYGKKVKRKMACEKSSGLTKEQSARLKVKKSTIKQAGKGLFAAKDIPKGTKLGYYAGVYMNERGYDKLNNQDYVWEVSRDKYVDAKPCPRATLRYINSKMPKKGTKRSFNVEPYTYKGKLWYRTTKPIKAGDELFIDYGEYYWD
jgi:SET domain-containing protein